MGLYDVKYNPTEKQLVILLSSLLLKKKPPPPGIEPGTIRSEARRSTRWAIEALLKKLRIFGDFIPKTAKLQYSYEGGGYNLPPGWDRVNLSAKMHGPADMNSWINNFVRHYFSFFFIHCIYAQFSLLSMISRSASCILHGGWEQWKALSKLHEY